MIKLGFRHFTLSVISHLVGLLTLMCFEKEEINLCVTLLFVSTTKEKGHFKREVRSETSQFRLNGRIGDRRLKYFNVEKFES